MIDTCKNYDSSSEDEIKSYDDELELNDDDLEFDDDDDLEFDDDDDLEFDDDDDLEFDDDDDLEFDDDDDLEFYDGTNKYGYGSYVDEYGNVYDKDEQGYYFRDRTVFETCNKCDEAEVFNLHPGTIGTFFNERKYELFDPASYMIYDIYAPTEDVFSAKQTEFKPEYRTGTHVFWITEEGSTTCDYLSDIDETRSYIKLDEKQLEELTKKEGIVAGYILSNVLDTRTIIKTANMLIEKSENGFVSFEDICLCLYADNLECSSVPMFRRYHLVAYLNDDYILNKLLSAKEFEVCVKSSSNSENWTIGFQKRLSVLDDSTK